MCVCVCVCVVLTDQHQRQFSIVLWKHCCWWRSGDPLDPEMEPDTAQQESQEAAADQEEEEEEADPAVLAKKQKQLAKRGVTFEAKVDPKVCPWCVATAAGCTLCMINVLSCRCTTPHCVHRSYLESQHSTNLQGLQMCTEICIVAQGSRARPMYSGEVYCR